MPETQTACDCDTCQEMVRRRNGENLHDAVANEIRRAGARMQRAGNFKEASGEHFQSLARQLRCCEESEVEIADRGEIH